MTAWTARVHPHRRAACIARHLARTPSKRLLQEELPGLLDMAALQHISLRVSPTVGLLPV